MCEFRNEVWSDYTSYDYGVDLSHRGKFRGISRPKGAPAHPPLYGESLRALSQHTQSNLETLRDKLIQHDPCYEYGMEHWHTEHAKDAYPTPHVYPDHARPTWKYQNTVFTSWADLDYLGKKKAAVDSKGVPVPEDGAPNFCYLCSTLEEHEQHLAKRGHQLKAKPERKLRIGYVAPTPTVKEKEVEEKEQKAEVLYKVTVYTGDKPNADTSANVFLTLHGRDNGMKKRQLTKKMCVSHVFGRGCKDTFYLKAPNLGELVGMKIEHDGMERKHSWFLQEVEVTDVANHISWIFVCKNWLSLFTRDATCVRKIRAERLETEEREYDIRVVTGELPLSGTDSRVFITLYGKKGVSAKSRLQPKRNSFERGSKDQFIIVAPSVGQITKIRIEHDNSGKNSPDWLLEKIDIITDTGKAYHFPCGEWLSESEGDGNLFRFLYPTDKKALEKIEKAQKDEETQNAVRYEVRVMTGNVRYAGTDANVYMVIVGSLSLSHEIKLDDYKNNFEKGKTDVFQVSTASIGTVKKIRIRHDNSGMGAGWFLDSVYVRRFLPVSEIRERLAEMNADVQEELIQQMAEITGTKIEGSAVRRASLAHQASYRKEDSDDDRYEKKRKDRKGRKKHSKYSESDSGSGNEDGRYKSTYKKKSRKLDRYGRPIDESDSDDDKKTKKKGRKYRSDGSNSDDDNKYRYKSKEGKRNKSLDRYERKEGKGRYGKDDSDSEDDNKTRRRKKSTHGRHSDDSDTDDYRKKHKQDRRKSKTRHGKDHNSDTDESSDEKSRKKKKEKKKRLYSYNGIDTLVTESDDSEEEKSRKHKGKKTSKYRDDDSGSDKGKRKQRRKSKSRSKSDSSSSSDSDTDKHKKHKDKKSRSRKKRKDDESDTDSESAEDKLQVLGLFKDWRKGRIPFCDEYVFVCKRWLADNEDDGLIERELRPKSVTTYYRGHKK